MLVKEWQMLIIFIVSVKCQHPKFVAICSEPPQRTPLLWTYYDKALLNPYFWGGIGG